MSRGIYSYFFSLASAQRFVRKLTETRVRGNSHGLAANSSGEGRMNFLSLMQSVLGQRRILSKYGPMSVLRLFADIRRKLGVRYFYDWGGGLVWLAVVGADDAGASVVREAMVNTGGHATLVRASSEIRRRIDVFEPLPPAVLKLTQEIKKSFDPDRVLNFGRMYAGI